MGITSVAAPEGESWIILLEKGSFFEILPKTKKTVLLLQRYKMAAKVKPVQPTEIKDKRIAREVIEQIRKPIPMKIIKRNEKLVAYMRELKR
jgi:hypothetical protein